MADPFGVPAVRRTRPGVLEISATVEMVVVMVWRWRVS